MAKLMLEDRWSAVGNYAAGTFKKLRRRMKREEQEKQQVHLTTIEMLTTSDRSRRKHCLAIILRGTRAYGIELSICLQWVGRGHEQDSGYGRVNKYVVKRSDFCCCESSIIGWNWGWCCCDDPTNNGMPW